MRSWQTCGGRILCGPLRSSNGGTARACCSVSAVLRGWTTVLPAVPNSFAARCGRPVGWQYLSYSPLPQFSVLLPAPADQAARAQRIPCLSGHGHSRLVGAAMHASVPQLMNDRKQSKGEPERVSSFTMGIHARIISSHPLLAADSSDVLWLKPLASCDILRCIPPWLLFGVDCSDSRPRLL